MIIIMIAGCGSMTCGQSGDEDDDNPIMMKLTISSDGEVDNPSNNIHDDRAFAPLKLVDHDCGKDQTEHSDDEVDGEGGGDDVRDNMMDVMIMMMSVMAKIVVMIMVKVKLVTLVATTMLMMIMVVVVMLMMRG